MSCNAHTEQELFDLPQEVLASAVEKTADRLFAFAQNSASERSHALKDIAQLVREAPSREEAEEILRRYVPDEPTEFRIRDSLDRQIGQWATAFGVFSTALPDIRETAGILAEGGTV